MALYRLLDPHDAAVTVSKDYVDTYRVTSPPLAGPLGSTLKF